MSKYLNRQIDRVFIILGTRCNLNCKYCMQHEITEKQIFSKINPDIYDFLTETAYSNRNHRLLLTFYGGEPLLYFGNIKTIVETLNRRNGVQFDFGIITNAKLLTDEMVAFFNDNNVGVAVSYDGANVNDTRGYDAFSNPKHKERILALKDLCLTGVISAKNYPLEIIEAMQKISNEYYQLHGYHLRINLDELLDVGIADSSLWNFDYSRVSNEIQQIINDVDKYIKGEAYNYNDCLKTFYINSLITNYLQGESNRDNLGYICYCGNGYNVLNIDLNGNLYPCHNTGCVVGNITDDYFTYLRKVIEHDKTRFNRDECLQCPVFNICMGGCKLVKNKEAHTCKLMRALYKPVIEYIKNFGGESVADSNL